MDGCHAGGIRALLDLIEEHRGAIEYDWRTRFGLPLSAIGTDAMDWGEAYRLAMILLGDQTAHLCAAAAGWTSPWSRDTEMLAVLVEITLRRSVKYPDRVRPWPRPWPDAATTTTAKPTLPQPVVRAVLQRARDGRIRFRGATTV